MESVQLKYYMHKRLYEYIWAQGGWFKNNIGYMVQKGIDRPSLGGCQGPTTYSLMIRWWEINLIRVFFGNQGGYLQYEGVLVPSKG